MLETTLGGTCQDQKNGNQPNSTHQLETTSGGTCQDTEIKQSSEQYSRSEDRIGGGDLSEQGKKASEQGALTSWKPHREILVRTQKESSWERGTDELETTSGETCQYMERKQHSVGHSLPGDRIRRALSGHGKKVTKQGAPTSWRPHWEELVRTGKESDGARGTHSLATSGVTCQGMERKRIQQGALTAWRPHWEGLIGTWKESN